MFKDISALVLYRNFCSDRVISLISGALSDFKTESTDSESEKDIKNRLSEGVSELLKVASKYGLCGNIWQGYLTVLIAESENPFSLACENAGDRGVSLKEFAKADFSVIKSLFEIDFSEVEEEFNINYFTLISDYKPYKDEKGAFDTAITAAIGKLSERIAKTADENGIYEAVTSFYSRFGVGKFAFNKAFRVSENSGKAEILPINSLIDTSFDDIIGYERQKEKLINNTSAFINGKKANNCLLYGDAGTGKSSSIKAVLNKFYPDGLRMIEIYKHQLKHLTEVIEEIRNRNYRFIIYMDDLSFEDFETEYKYLKAVIEGGLEVRPDNVLIYATSNRRHLIKEIWDDRKDMEYNGDIHRSDTMQEKLSLAARFGIAIGYFAPDGEKFLDIVLGIAKEYPELEVNEEDLVKTAKRWELTCGGRSGRAARQLIHHLLGSGN